MPHDETRQRAQERDSMQHDTPRQQLTVEDATQQLRALAWTGSADRPALRALAVQACGLPPEAGDLAFPARECPLPYDEAKRFRALVARGIGRDVTAAEVLQLLGLAGAHEEALKRALPVLLGDAAVQEYVFSFVHAASRAARAANASGDGALSLARFALAGFGASRAVDQGDEFSHQERNAGLLVVATLIDADEIVGAGFLACLRVCGVHGADSHALQEVWSTLSDLHPSRLQSDLIARAAQEVRGMPRLAESGSPTDGEPAATAPSRHASSIPPEDAAIGYLTAAIRAGGPIPSQADCARAAGRTRQATRRWPTFLRVWRNAKSSEGSGSPRRGYRDARTGALEAAE